MRPLMFSYDKLADDCLDRFDEIIKSPNIHSTEVKEWGQGFASTLRVRFLHASVRRRILRLARESPSYYSVETHGIPISDFDCIGTALVRRGVVLHHAGGVAVRVLHGGELRAAPG